MLVCRVTLGYSCRTLGVSAGSSSNVMHCMDTDKPVFHGTVKKLNECKAGFEYHSLVAETGGALARYREFIFYHEHVCVPMYLVAYHRMRDGERV